ncbi:MFS transporter [Paenibacillus sp. P25]|nr:MFS transporter [Paenibacillus sp. P25]
MESKKKFVVTGLFFGPLFTEMDETIIGTAMPAIVRELGGLALYGWVSGIYLLALAAGLPIMGKLADLYGRKRIYLCALGMFLAGSTLSGFAGSMPMLLVFRAVQGLGGAGLIPLASVIVADLFPLERRARIQGLFGSLYVIVTTVGPAVGGSLTQYADWRWIFYMNLPFGLTAALFIAVGLKESASENRERLDLAGALLLPAGLIPLMLTAVRVGDGINPGPAWESPVTWVLAVGGLLLLGLFIRVELKAEQPVLPLYVFKRRVVAIVSVLAFCVSFGTFGVLTYLPFYAQNVLGFSPAAAGYLMTPLALGAVVSGLVFAFLVAKVSYRLLFAVSLCMAAVGFALLAALPLNGSAVLPYVYVFIAGLGIGVVMMGKETVVQEQVNKEDIGSATATGFADLPARCGVGRQSSGRRAVLFRRPAGSRS